MEQLYSELIRSANGESFYTAMAGALGPQLGVSAISAYLVAPDGQPAPRLQLIPEASLRVRSLPVSAYRDWAYRVDPLHQAFCAGLPAGVYRLHELLAGDLASTEFYQQFYGPVGAGDELLQLVPLEGGRALAFYFVRDRDEPAFQEQEYRQLRRISPVLAEATALHEAWRPAGESAPGVLEIWLTALQELGGGRLTRRERQILQCVLLGMRVDECAQELNLSHSTVKNHRKAAYRKLAVRSASELLTVLLCGDSPHEPPASHAHRAGLRRQWLTRLSLREQRGNS